MQPEAELGGEGGLILRLLLVEVGRAVQALPPHVVAAPAEVTPGVLPIAAPLALALALSAVSAFATAPSFLPAERLLLPLLVATVLPAVAAEPRVAASLHRLVRRGSRGSPLLATPRAEALPRRRLCAGCPRLLDLRLWVCQRPGARFPRLDHGLRCPGMDEPGAVPEIRRQVLDLRDPGSRRGAGVSTAAAVVAMLTKKRGGAAGVGPPAAV